MNLNTFLKLLLLYEIAVTSRINATSVEKSTINDTEQTKLSTMITTYRSRNLKPYEYANLTFHSEEDKVIAKQLEIYFKLRDMCPFELNVTSVDQPPSAKYCRSTADYLFCFPSTPANTTLYFNCPYKEQIKGVIRKPNETVSRYCMPNGVWDSIDYIHCMPEVMKALYSHDCVIKTIKNEQGEEIKDLVCVHEDLFIFKLIAALNLTGFSITNFFVSIAILIFLTIRSLRCTRNMIHCNMLFTFLFKSSAHIGLFMFVLTKDQPMSAYNHVMCVVYMIIIKYSVLCSFFWMMIEAVYLITVIVAAYSSNKIKLWWYLIIGWVIPLIPIIPYSIITFNTTNATCAWITSDYDPLHELIINVPIYVILSINCILLVTILFVIVTKLKTHNDTKTKYSQYKKLIRASLVLFPLFGLTFAIFAWLPSNPRTTFSKIYYFVNIFLQTTQGVWVAFVYCFLNDEVKSAVRTKLRSWKISHTGSSLLTIGSSSSRHHSIPTLYTTTNSNSSRIRVDSNPHDPARLPILQEDKI